jgi:hypothetical protein
MACATRVRFVPLPSSVAFVVTTCSVMRTCVPRTVRMRSIARFDHVAIGVLETRAVCVTDGELQ